MGSLGITWHIWWPYSDPSFFLFDRAFFSLSQIKLKMDSTHTLKTHRNSLKTENGIERNGTEQNSTFYSIDIEMHCNGNKEEKKEEMLQFFLSNTLCTFYTWLQMYVIKSLCQMRAAAAREKKNH